MQHEPPEMLQQSASDEEDETKSLATHIALRPTVVREAVGTKSRRTGKLNAGDFLQVHEEQMGQKGVNRLKITVVPEVMPEEEYAFLPFQHVAVFALYNCGFTYTFRQACVGKM